MTNCVVPENIHTSPPDIFSGFTPPPPPQPTAGNSNLASYFLLNILTIVTPYPPPPPHPLWIFNDYPWGGYRYFLEPHIHSTFWDRVGFFGVQSRMRLQNAAPQCLVWLVQGKGFMVPRATPPHLLQVSEMANFESLTPSLLVPHGICYTVKLSCGTAYPIIYDLQHL